jgi:hypothetical protein
MQKVLNTQPEVRFLRVFLNKVWAFFNSPTIEVEA